MKAEELQHFLSGGETCTHNGAEVRARDAESGPEACFRISEGGCFHTLSLWRQGEINAANRRVGYGIYAPII